MTSIADNGFPLNIESLLASTHRLLRARGANDAASLLANAEAHAYQADYDNWNGGTAIWGIRLALDIEVYAALSDAERSERCAELSDAVSQFFVDFANDSFGRVSLKPKVSEDLQWRGAIGMPSAQVRIPQNKWREIGRGGFGTVYVISDEQLGVDFALKVFDPSSFNNHEDGRRRFLREAGLLYRLHHEYIVRIFEAGVLSNDKPFIKMEYFPGVSLQSFLDTRPLSAQEALYVIGRIAGALEHAHQRQILHRDIKPTNILVSQAIDAVRLIDFGLGLLVEEAVSRERLTRSGQYFGDAYSSPEMREDPRSVGYQTDIYSLGAIWFRLLCGRAPHGAGIDAAIRDSELDADARILLARCLGPIDARPTATQLLQELRSLWKKQPVR